MNQKMKTGGNLGAELVVTRDNLGAELVSHQRFPDRTKSDLETAQMLNRGLFGSSTRTESLLCSSNSARGQRSLCFPLGALGFGFGAFRGTAQGSQRARSVPVRSLVLTRAGGDVRLLVLLTAQLSRDGEGAQRPLLVGLTEGVGAELTEGLRVFPTDVAVVPGTVPASCRGTGGLVSLMTMTLNNQPTGFPTKQPSLW